MWDQGTTEILAHWELEERPNDCVKISSVDNILVSHQPTSIYIAWILTTSSLNKVTMYESLRAFFHAFWSLLFSWDGHTRYPVHCKLFNCSIIIYLNWNNNLPTRKISKIDMATFKSALKTYLFSLTNRDIGNL